MRKFLFILINLSLFGASDNIRVAVADRAYEQLLIESTAIVNKDPIDLTESEWVSILDYIKSKNYSLSNIVTYLISADNAGDDILVEPILRLLLHNIVSFLQDSKHKLVMTELSRLPKHIKDRLKILYYDFYTVDLLHHYTHNEQLQEQKIIFSPNRKFIIKYTKEKITIMQTSKLYRDNNSAQIQNSQELILGNFSYADTIELKAKDFDTRALFEDVKCNDKYVAIVIGNKLGVYNIKLNTWKFGFALKQGDKIYSLNNDNCILLRKERLSGLFGLLAMEPTVAYFYNINSRNRYQDNFNYSGKLNCLYIDKSAIFISQPNGMVQLPIYFDEIHYEDLIERDMPKFNAKDFFKKCLYLRTIFNYAGEFVENSKYFSSQTSGKINLDTFSAPSYNTMVHYYNGGYKAQVSEDILNSILYEIYNQDFEIILNKIYPNKSYTCSIM